MQLMINQDIITVQGEKNGGPDPLCFAYQKCSIVIKMVQGEIMETDNPLIILWRSMITDVRTFQSKWTE
jgi:hypothetical protein